MPKTPKKFKPSPRKFHPKGLPIVYEDHDIIVVNKAPGVLTMGYDKVKESTAYFLLNRYVKKGNHKSRNRVLMVHRLDRDTTGLLVFAKSEAAKKYLMDEWKTFTKTYYAVVYGAPPDKEGLMQSYLAEGENYTMVSVDDPSKGKLAKTGYKVVAQNRKYSLLEINLHTGKKNQIRVHMADAGCPVVGDQKYGARREKGPARLALHAASLAIRHPYTHQKMTFEANIPMLFESLMNRS